MLRRVALSRGRLWVDENLANVVPYLEKLSFRVNHIKPGTQHDEIKQMIMTDHFLTANSKDFKEDIAIFEYCLINVDALLMQPPDVIAKRVSDVWRELGLKHQESCEVRITQRTQQLIPAAETVLPAIQEQEIKGKLPAKKA
ncbi:hypothetical protein D1Y84_09340 [Acidipila sp. EB88]|nr:hypothetical protein D1Y84_09340 [Acidipila sp. EB88]